MYHSSAGLPTFSHDGGPRGGSMFLISQAHYLSRGLNCTDADAPLVHLLCSERFDDEWTKLLSRYGNPIGASARSEGRLTLLREKAKALGSSMYTVLTGRAAPWRAVERHMFRSNASESSASVDQSLLPAAEADNISTHELKARLASTGLSEADARFVREQLYPWDAALHRLVCGSMVA